MSLFTKTISNSNFEEVSSSDGNGLPSGLGMLDPNTKLSTMSSLGKIPSIYQNSPTESHTKQILCLQMLCEGYVTSFVDFFYLTHKMSEEVKETAVLGGSAGNQYILPDAHMRMVRHHLTDAEASLRHSDSNKVFESYDELAAYFSENKDYKTCVYFLKKNLDHAEAVKNTTQICNACEKLAVACNNLEDIDSVIKYLSMCTKLISSDDESFLYSIHGKLSLAYLTKATQLRDSKDYKNALVHYEYALRGAVESKNQKVEATSAYEIGLTCQAIGSYDEAHQWQERCLALCRTTQDYEGEAQAHISLADLYERFKDFKSATIHYEQCYSLAVRYNMQKTQITTCTHLGTIATNIGQHEKAVAYFEKAYEIAKQLKDRKMIDQTRIHLGMSKGNLGMKMLNNKQP